MTTLAIAHKEGHARMVRALEQYAKERTTPMNPSYVRITGHAGVWQVDGPALVLTDDDCFEHPTLLNVHQVADPGRFAVVEPADLITADAVAVAS